MNIWSPGSSTINGWVIETPIHSPDLPANLWVHVSGISKDWGGFPPALTNADWHDASGILVAAVAAGDTVLAAQGAIGLAAAHREETSLFNSDDWGMAIDAVGLLPAPVVGQSSVVLPVSMRTLGNCWPVAVAVTVDMLVLRDSLIPQTPLPYGQRPKPGIRLRDRILLRETYLEELKGITARRKVLKRLLKALDEETLEAEPPPPGLPRPVTLGLTLSMRAPLAPAPRRPEPGAEAPAAGRPRPDKPRRRKS